MVEFLPDSSSWAGNFRPGLGGVDQLCSHPDGRRVLVFAKGDLWSVDPDERTAEYVMPAVSQVWEISDPPSILMSRQGLAFFLFAADGIVWHTRRLSWDGFDEVRVECRELRGLAWNPVNDSWDPFTVDMRTGQANGSYSDSDVEGWERLRSR